MRGLSILGQPGPVPPSLQVQAQNQAQNQAQREQNATGPKLSVLDMQEDEIMTKPREGDQPLTVMDKLNVNPSQ